MNASENWVLYKMCDRVGTLKIWGEVVGFQIWMLGKPVLLGMIYTMKTTSTFWNSRYTESSYQLSYLNDTPGILSHFLIPNLNLKCFFLSWTVSGLNFFYKPFWHLQTILETVIPSHVKNIGKTTHHNSFTKTWNYNNVQFCTACTVLPSKSFKYDDDQLSI